ncbi:cysteine--tRNA ligase [bacterium BMS3Abin04]|nr:cysteine--tRNA ligase [bacterium BMS3Abin04]
MEIYNTLTKKKEEFKPVNPPNVGIYVCGPTVYDFFHIGNARSFVMADIMQRYLRYKGYKVKFVMNLTDVDDKIIKKANEEDVEASVIAERFTNAFFEDIEKLKIKKADVYPKATGHIKEILELIKKLEINGIAYNTGGDVFYDVHKFKEYGKLSGKKLDDLEAGARVEVNDKKHNPLDFALWKSAKEGEPHWSSPWGEGRPGWHIECSAMSMKHLGETFDIHAGGHDLIFPHHENEIAQSEGVSHKPFVKYWVHFGFLNIKNEKMSKSLGNFFTARDVIKRFSAETIRLLFSQAHYASPLNFSDELLTSAQKGLEKITNFVQTINNKLDKAEPDGNYPEFIIQTYYDKFEQAMDDDFNSPKAVAVIFDLIKNVNKILSEDEQWGSNFYEDILDFLNSTAEAVLGIIQEPVSASESTNETVDKLLDLLVQIRTKAKKEKLYEFADQIREKLSELGFTLVDTKDGTEIKK